jgi:hypothetical protein
MQPAFQPLLPALALAALLAPPLTAQQPGQEAWDAIKQQMDTMAQEIRDLRLQVTGLKSQLDAATSGAGAAGDEYYIPRLAGEFTLSGQSQQLGGVYTKPWLGTLGERTHLGGYLDLEFKDGKGDENQFFDQHRLVPFIYSDVSDRVKVSTELEFEHGHEVEVEFAQIDYLFSPAFAFRAGIMLLPLGKLNEVHDSPIQDLTERPLVDRYIIPTTLRDAGVGAYGDLGDDLSYMVTVTNGFKGLDAAGTSAITAKDGLRKAAPQSDELADAFEQINDQLAYAGRLAWSPILGSEVGVSAMEDTYDEDGDNDLRIMALDGTLDGKAVGWLPDPMELLGEAAWANVDRNGFAQASGVADDMHGYYVQANWHLDPGFLERWRADGTVSQDAHFTFVTRYDHVNLDTYDMRRTTLGLNFRPNAHDTVYKLDYQLNDDSGSEQGLRDDDALLFSVATYF